MSQLADYPVLVDRSDAIAILGVTASTFDRLCREGRFENRVCAGPPRELYMASELRRYRAQDKRLGASAKSVTNAADEPSKSAGLAVTSETEIVACTGERPGTTNGLPEAVPAAPRRHACVLARVQAANGPAEEAIRVTIEENDPGDLTDLAELGELSADPPAGLSEADFHGCRWIGGEPAPLRSKMFCGKPTRPGSSWCAEHYRIAFGRAARRRDAA